MDGLFWGVNWKKKAAREVGRQELRLFVDE